MDLSALDHVRIISIKSPSDGEFYVNYQPSIEQKTGEHDSYHKSGRFHWKTPNMPSIVPIEGEADRRRAFLLKQATDHFSGQLLGYCLAIKIVDPKSLRAMLGILHGLIIPDFDIDITLKRLLEYKQMTIPIPPSQHVQRAQELLRSPADIMTQQELITSLRSQLGPDVNIFISDPKCDRYLLHSSTVIKGVFEIAREFVSEKFADRPLDFYARAIGEQELFEGDTKKEPP